MSTIQCFGERRSGYFPIQFDRIIAAVYQPIISYLDIHKSLTKKTILIYEYIAGRHHKQHGWMHLAICSHLGANPIQDRSNAGIHAWESRSGTTETPRNYSNKRSCTTGTILGHSQWTCKEEEKAQFRRIIYLSEFN